MTCWWGRLSAETAWHVRSFCWTRVGPRGLCPLSWALYAKHVGMQGGRKVPQSALRRFPSRASARLTGRWKVPTRCCVCNSGRQSCGKGRVGPVSWRATCHLPLRGPEALGAPVKCCSFALHFNVILQLVSHRACVCPQPPSQKLHCAGVCAHQAPSWGEGAHTGPPPPRTRCTDSLGMSPGAPPECVFLRPAVDLGLRAGGSRSLGLGGSVTASCGDSSTRPRPLVSDPARSCPGRASPPSSARAVRPPALPRVLHPAG